MSTAAIERYALRQATCRRAGARGRGAHDRALPPAHAGRLGQAAARGRSRRRARVRAPARGRSAHGRARTRRRAAALRARPPRARARSVGRRAALALRRLRTRDRAALLRPGTPPRRQLHRADGRDARGDIAAARPSTGRSAACTRCSPSPARSRRISSCARSTGRLDARSLAAAAAALLPARSPSVRRVSRRRRGGESHSGSGAADASRGDSRCSRCRRSPSRCCSPIFVSRIATRPRPAGPRGRLLGGGSSALHALGGAAGGYGVVLRALRRSRRRRRASPWDAVDRPFAAFACRRSSSPAARARR